MRRQRNNLDPIHSGEILLEEFLKPMDLSMNQLAKGIGVPSGRVSEIVREHRAITADTALRLEKFFGVSPALWLDLQSDYEMRLARQERWSEIDEEVQPYAA